jgi:hypothetical protein
MYSVHWVAGSSTVDGYLRKNFPLNNLKQTLGFESIPRMIVDIKFGKNIS